MDLDAHSLHSLFLNKLPCKHSTLVILCTFGAALNNCSCKELMHKKILPCLQTHDIQLLQGTNPFLCYCKQCSCDGGEYMLTFCMFTPPPPLFSFSWPPPSPPSFPPSQHATLYHSAVWMFQGRAMMHCWQRQFNRWRVWNCPLWILSPSRLPWKA